MAHSMGVDLNDPRDPISEIVNIGIRDINPERVLLLLCPSCPLFNSPGRQAFASSVVLEPRFLVPPQPTGHGPADAGRPVATQEPVEYQPDRLPDLRQRQRRGPLFSPAGSPASGTTRPPATAPGGGASPPTSAPGSRPVRPPPWPASSTPRPGAGP